MKRLLFALALVACSSPERGPRWQAAGAASPRTGGSLRMSIIGNVRTLDPSIAYDEHSIIAVHSVFDTLVDYAPASTALVPRLAERWEITPDGLTYRFWLRAGAAYSDGTPVVARDFKTSLERAQTTADSPFGPMLTDVASIATPSDTELVITLARPNAAFLYILTMTFATPQRAEHIAAAGDQLRRMPLGSGPYMVSEWSEGEKLVLRKNPHYTDRTRGHLAEIVMLENLPRDTQFLMFERGELDSAEKLTSPDLLWISSQSAWQPYVHRMPTLNVFGFRMNVRVKPFDDRRVRQALNYAANKQHTLKLLNGTAVASHGMLPPGVVGRDDALAPYPHDPAKARALLAEAGYPDGFDVELVTFADEEAEKLATSLQSDLAAVGVRARISLMSFATYYSAVSKPDGVPLSISSWIGDYPDPSTFLDTRFHSRAIADENSANDSFYANPELDALLDTARAEPELAKRTALYRRAERILYDDAPWIWDYHRVMTEVTQPYVAGYTPHPVWGRDYTSTWLDVGPDGQPVPR